MGNDSKLGLLAGLAAVLIIAVVYYQKSPPSANGADQVVASVTVNGVAASASKGYQLAASNVTISSFTFSKPALVRSSVMRASLPPAF